MLREGEYADDARLDVRRRTHQLYTLDPVDFGRWTLDRLAWRGDERVLDVGCGPGDLLLAMARQNDDWSLLAGVDISAGMAAQAAGSAAGLPVHLAVSDAQALPFSPGTFDVVMARHMLYHVPDMDRAVAEAARVLVAGGRFLVTTNSGRTMPEYMAIRHRAAARFAGVGRATSISDRFTLENGPALLARHFCRVEVHSLPGTLRFPTVEPFMDYFASTRSLTMHPGHTEAEWAAVLAFVRAEAQEIVARQGRLDVTKIAGAIVAWKEG